MIRFNHGASREVQSHLARLRAANWSYSAIARQIGISRSSVTRYAQGTQAPDQDTLACILAITTDTQRPIGSRAPYPHQREEPRP